MVNVSPIFFRTVPGIVNANNLSGNTINTGLHTATGQRVSAMVSGAPAWRYVNHRNNGWHVQWLPWARRPSKHVFLYYLDIHTHRQVQTSFPISQTNDWSTEEVRNLLKGHTGK